jgi:hypothetical protein
MSLSYSLVEHFNDHEEPTESVDNPATTASTEAGDNTATTESQLDCMTRCQDKCSRTPDENELDDDATTAAGDATTAAGDDETTATTSSLDIEDGSNESTSETSTETFSNMNNLNSNLNSNLNTGRSFWSLDLLLKSVLFACLFYVLAHTKTRATVTKYLVRGKENVSYVLMVVFALVYYLLHLVV